MFGKQNGFVNIPLRRRIEALALALVTVLASASVDWSSLTARAEGGADLTNYVTLSNDDPVIIQEIVGNGGEGTESIKPYDSIVAAYANFKVTGGSADYKVDLYQNYNDDFFTTNYKTYTSANCVINKNKTSSGISGTLPAGRFTDGQIKPLWSASDFEEGDAPINLAYGERAAIVVTFTNITDGTIIKYGTDSKGNAIDVTRKSLGTFTESGTSISGGETPIVMTTDQTEGVSIKNRFSLSPKYLRKISYTFDPTGVVDYNENEGIISPKTDATAFAAEVDVTTGGAITLKVPIKVVNKGTDPSSKEYDGQPVAGVAPKCGDTALKEGSDYTVTYNGRTKAEAVNVGKYTAEVNGINDYVGLNYSQTFEITQRSLGSSDTLDTGDDGYTLDLTKLQINPAGPEIIDKDFITDKKTQKALIKDTDYRVVSLLRDSEHLEKFTLTIEGINNYKDTVKIQIDKANLTKDAVNLATMIKDVKIKDSTGNTSCTFDATSHPLTVSLYDSNGTELKGLKVGTDYTYSIYKVDDPTKEIYQYKAGDTTGGVTEAGTYKVIVTALSTSYVGSVDSSQLATAETFTVKPVQLAANNIVVTVPSNQKVFYYDGTNKDSLHPTTITAYFPYGSGQQWPMTEGKDFTVEEYDPYKSGHDRYSFKIKGIDGGNFSGEVYFGDKNQTDLATGSDPFFKILDSLDAATVTLSCNGQTTVAEKPENGEWTRVADASAFQPTFTGERIEPAVSLTLGTKTLTSDDYTVTYDPTSCSKAGTASLFIKGKGNYVGQSNSITVNFTIGAKTLDSNAVTVNVSDTTKVYDFGNAITLNYTTGSDSDFVVYGDATKKTPRLTMAAPTEEQIASGDDAIAAAFPNADYYVTYENNTEASQKTGSKARIVAHGINNYKGTATGEFTIAPIEIKEGVGFVVADLPDMSYTGSDITIPDDKIIVTYTRTLSDQLTLMKDTDYTVVYSSNRRNKTENKDTYIDIQGKGNYGGSIRKYYKIIAKSINDGSVMYIIGQGAKSSDYKELGKAQDSGKSVEYSGAKETSKSLPISLRLKDNESGYLQNGEDYEVKYPEEFNVGYHTIRINGMGNYDGSYASITYYVDQKDINNVSNLNVYSISASDYSSVKAVGKEASVLTTGTDIKRYYQVRNGSNVTTDAVPNAVTENGGPTKSYTWSWSRTSGADAGVTGDGVPTIAGDDYTLTLTGTGNYKGTKTFTTDASGKPLMVGASLDVMNAVLLAEADRSYNVPFLGDNQPVVQVNTSALTAANVSQNNSVNDNIVIDMKDDAGNAVTTLPMIGPAYTNGKYENSATDLDYTIDYVDDSGNAVTSFAVGQTFHARITAVEGSPRFFGRHTMGYAPGSTTSSSHATVVASDLGKLAARSDITVTDPNSTQPYEKKAADTTATSKLSYAYTGSTITPSLTVTIVPQATDEDKAGVFKDGTDTFAPIDLAKYGGFTYTTDNTADNTVLAADVKDNGTITLLGDGTNFTNGKTDQAKRQVKYEITAHELTQDDITIDASKLNYTYDGTSHKDDITGAVTVSSMGTKLKEGTDYTLKFFKDKECKNEAKEDSTNKDFTNAGTLYAQITPVANATGKNFTIPTTGLVAETPFTIAKADLKGATIALGAPVNAADNTAAYTGSEIKPTVTVTLDGNTVTDSEYTVSYADNTDVGTAKVTVTGNGTNYSGTVSKDFYIYVDLSKLTAVGIAEGSSYILDKTGQPVSDDTTKTLLDYQNVTFKNGSSVVSIESGTNYTVSLTHQDLTTARYGLKEPGKYTVTYEGRGKEYGCRGTKSYNITIKGDLSTAEVQIKNYTDGYTYDATKHVYGPSASDLLVTLTSGYVVPSKCYKVSQGAGDTSKPKTDVSTEDPYVLLTASDSYSAYYTLSAAADASGRHIPFTIKYDLSKVTIKAKDGQTLEYNDTEDIDSKIAVYYPGVTDALDTQTYQVESARWVNAQSSNKAQLIISLLPDAGNVFSKGKASKTIDGQFKEWATPTIDSDKAKAVYNGQSHIDDFRAAVTIADSSGNPLNYGADYTITFKKGSETGSTDTSVIEADKYYAFIKGAGDYYTSTWTKLETVFEVTPKALTGMTLTPSDENAKYYTGKAPVISFTIHDDETGKDLQAGTDYELSSVVTQNSNADLWNIGTTIKYTAKGAGNYDSTTSIEYTLTIEAANISKAGVVDIPNKSVVYNGKEQKPSFIVNRVSSTGEVLTPLVRNTDYTFDDSQLSGQDFTNVGNYTYSIKGIGKYTGELNFKYEITPRDIGDAVITLDQADGVYPYANGSPVTPVVTASIILENGDAATPLDVTKDYTLAITSNTASHAADDSAAAPTVTLTGTGNYTGTAKKTFQIGSDISTATVTLSKTAQDYDPAATFRPTVKSIAVTGGETYTETSATKVSDVATVTYQTTTGTALAATEPVNAGTYQVLVTGKGPFFGSQAVNYKINPMETEKSDIKVAIVEDGSNGQQVDDDGNIYYYYSGKAIKPKVTVRYQPDPDEVGILLKEATTEDHSDGDYYLDYKENTNAGDAQILVYLRGNYSGQGTKKKTFEIRPVDITDFTLTLQKKTASYTGKAITKDFTLEGTNPAGDDFSWDSEDYTTTQLKNQGLTVTWSANIAPGTANLVVSGNGGNFTGTAAPATLTIVADLSDATITPTEVFRTGNALSPDITLHFRDSYGDDHPITTESGWFRVKSYTPDTGDWTTATKMTVTVVPTADGDSYLEGTGKYTITLSSTPTDLSIEGYNATYQYTGAKIQPSTLSVKNLPSGATVSYTETSSADGSACILPGTVTLTAKVTFKDANGNTTTTDVTEGKYGKKATFNITKRPIKACNFQGPSDTRYTGSAVTPIFSINTGAVQLRNGVDYTYTITGNTNPGTATITIRGKGNYIGMTNRTFNIFVGTPTQLTVGSRSGSTATITWKAVPHASGYRVIYTNTAGVQKKLITTTSYTLTNLKSSGQTQVTVEAYVANAAANPLYYSNPTAVYVR